MWDTHLLILLGDHLADDLVVLEGGQPELRNTLDVGLVTGLVDLFDTGLVVLILRVGHVANGLTGSDLVLSRLGLSGNDLLSSSVERCVSCGVLRDESVWQRVSDETLMTCAEWYLKRTFFSISRISLWNSLSILECSV
jgi:hypothetical protein